MFAEPFMDAMLVLTVASPCREHFRNTSLSPTGRQTQKGKSPVVVAFPYFVVCWVSCSEGGATKNTNRPQTRIEQEDRELSGAFPKRGTNLLTLYDPRAALVKIIECMCVSDWSQQVWQPRV